MVNVKKIGAIATGALFIGATFGMASAAVTVPSAFKSSMLASGGVAKAQLVVGDGAGGKTADTESAKEIQDAVKAKLASTVGGDISIEFGANELHDASTDTNTVTQVSLATMYPNDATVYSLNMSGTASLKFDGNADGDLKDSDDYDLYDRIVIVDQSNGDIQFAKSVGPDSSNDNGNSQLDEGELFKIKGTKYIITDNDTTDGAIEFGPAAFSKTLTQTTVDKDNAIRVSGDKKILFGSDDNLYFYSEGSISDGPISNETFGAAGITVKPYKMTSTDISSDEFKPYSIYVTNYTSGGTSVKVTMVENAQKTKVSNDEEGVLGYSKIKIGDTNWFSGGNANTQIFLLGDDISLVKGETIDLADTYYQLKYTSSKQFDILRKKVSGVTSGTKLKYNVAPGKDFLDDVKQAQVTMSVVGADIQTEYGANELHDASTDTNTVTQASLATMYPNDATVYSLNMSGTASLKFDGNADGDLKDSDDYDLYNRIVIVDQANGDIQFAQALYSDATFSVGAAASTDMNYGEVFKVKGTKYVLTDDIWSDGDFEFGPAAFAKTLTATTVDKDNAIRVSGEKKVLLGTDGALYFYSEGSISDGPLNITDGSLNSTFSERAFKMTSTQVSSDEFKPYSIYVFGNTSNTVKVTMVENAQKTKVSNDEEGVLGYSKAKVADSNWFTGGTDSIYLLGDDISLVKGETIDLADTYYQLKYTSSKQFDILRKKTATVSSGTKLKYNVAPGKDFLDTSEQAQITVTTTGGTAQTEGPTLDIVDDTDADDSMNLVLVGGPVANSLVADLVTNGKSTVAWEESDGDIEVISSAFKSGKYAIIAAGKTRTETKDAAAALAAEL